MSPKSERPSGALSVAIDKTFGDFARLKMAFVKAGTDQFGSGWVWLVADLKGAMSVRSTHDADDTLTQAGTTPLLVCDLWEHAYYLDHQNDRKGFLEAWFDALPNWQFAALQYEAAHGRGEAWRHAPPLTSTGVHLSKAS
jgi:Fe-Mn family superoxide dismutase